jgi:hypothetical protein
VIVSRSGRTGSRFDPADRHRPRAGGPQQRQLDGQDAVLVGRGGRVGVDVGPERDDAPERPVLDLELLVDGILRRRRVVLTVTRQHELAAGDLELDRVGVDPREVGAHDRARRVADVVDVDRR